MKLRLFTAAFMVAGVSFAHASEAGKRINDEQIQILLEFKAGLTTTTPQPIKLSDPQAILCGAPLNADIHANAWAMFMVSTTAHKEWRAMAKTYPEGTVLAKTKFADEKGAEITLHALMLKRGPSYNPEGGDWEYVLAGAKGNVQARGKLTSCMECHNRFKDTNHVAPVAMLSAGSK